MDFNIALSAIVLFSIISNGVGQMMSPCPTLFQYESDTVENDRWYGNLVLFSDYELTGVWLKLIFDKPSVQLGNWFGEVSTDDNTEYLIENPNFILQANLPHKLRFYVRYQAYDLQPPELISFRLNARTVCPEKGRVQPDSNTSGPLFTSQLSRPTKPPQNFQPPNGLRRNTGSNKGGPCSNYVPKDNSFDNDYTTSKYIIKGDRSKEPVKPVQCGIVATQAVPLVTNGQATTLGEFPWHVALYEMKGMDYLYFCGGTLINSQYLVTAAHCVVLNQTDFILEPESLIVYLGKSYLKRWTNPGIQERHVEQIKIHPKYKTYTYSNDIAIVKLATPAKMTDYVRPICLWTGDINLESIIGKMGTVVGWGFDDNYRKMQNLVKANMPVVSQRTCVNSYPDFYSRFTSNNTFCAGLLNGTSVCRGDSGGGMIFPSKLPNSDKLVWHLRGLVSISVNTRNNLNCDTSHYIVFTDVARYMTWITDNMK